MFGIRTLRRKASLKRREDTCSVTKLSNKQRSPWKAGRRRPACQAKVDRAVQCDPLLDVANVRVAHQAHGVARPPREPAHWPHRNTPSGLMFSPGTTLGKDAAIAGARRRTNGKNRRWRWWSSPHRRRAHDAVLDPQVPHEAQGQLHAKVLQPHTLLPNNHPQPLQVSPSRGPLPKIPTAERTRSANLSCPIVDMATTNDGSETVTCYLSDLY